MSRDRKLDISTEPTKTRPPNQIKSLIACIKEMQ